ncbi:MAG TPA: 1-phosphofructokinase [Selenomonas sp.]|nr:1-phosphofructokinase [Selenomonas sp.]
MIYTVTFNPSLDYIVRLDKFTAGEINRVNYEQVLAGGKGINVSIVLGNLGHESTALGFVAGFTGEEIKRQLKDRGVKTDFVQLESGFSRINVKAKAQQETEINGQGPDISEARQAELFSQLDKLGKGDTLVLAGSIPKTLPDNIYERIMAHLQSRDIRIVVDAEKRLLLNVLKYHPFLIKPNRHELEELFAAKISTPEEAEPYARRLQERGARNVLVSMGGQGAALLDEMGEFRFRASAGGMVINAVGAGDAMVAGFLAGWDAGHGAEYALRMGIAAGAASAFTDWMASGEQVMEVLRTLKKEEHTDMDSACPHAECL